MATKLTNATINVLKGAFEYNPGTGIFTSKRTGLAAGHGSNGAGDNRRPNYLIIKYKSKPYAAHRVAFAFTHGYWPRFIDHIDGDGTNNRILNLREVTTRQNSLNLPLQRRNKSGVIGVTWCKNRRKWKVSIATRQEGEVQSTPLYLGLFEDLFSAAAARKSAEITHDYHENHGRKRDD